MEAKTVKVSELTPESKNVNVLVKVISTGETKEIPSREGTRRVAEFLVGDETGAVLMSLWGEQISQVAQGDVLQINNGFVSLVRGNMRLNVGKYGNMKKSEQMLEAISEPNMSEKTYEMPERRRRFGRERGGGYGGRRRF